MIARVLALFIGLFIAVNFLGNFFWPGFDANLWWIHFGQWLPGWFAKGSVALCGIALLMFACQNHRRGQRSKFTAVLAVGLAGVALINAASFYWLLATSRIDAGFPVPFSLVVCGALLWIARAAWMEPRDDRSIHWGFIAGGSVCLFTLFPVALMLFFGNTDYRRPADAVIVFGARTYADGRLSDALQDRIRTACEFIARDWRNASCCPAGAATGS